MKNRNITIITGLSGSGKSTAAAAFEDAGFYCVDNMPVALLPDFLDLPDKNVSGNTGLAFVMDLRGRGFASDYTTIFDNLQSKGYTFDVVFLEADEKTLLQRFSQTRRHHPLSKTGQLIEGIRAEKELLSDIKKSSNIIIDTTHLNVHKLKSIFFEIIQKKVKVETLQVNVISFGFKYGTPLFSDLVIDVRFLNNPYFIPELKPYSGENKDVRDFVLGDSDAQTFLKKYTDLLNFLIPLYKKEGKAYLTIAIGCTGGRHRSVVISREIHNHIKQMGFPIELIHRDIDQ